jgi:hypothetical protein
MPAAMSCVGEAPSLRLDDSPVCASPADGAVYEKRENCADDRSDDTGRLKRTLVEVLAEQRPAKEPADEAADDAQNDRFGYGHRVGPRHQSTSHKAGKDADDQ